MKLPHPLSKFFIHADTSFIPAKARNHPECGTVPQKKWIPAFAGTTIFSLSLVFSPTFAAQGITETKNKLKQLDIQIHTLEQRIAGANNRKAILNQQLANTEKEISENILKLKQTHEQLVQKQRQIQLLNQVNQTLSKQLQTQKKLLINHIIARYKMGTQEPIRWMLNQQDPALFGRLLVYYQSILESRKRTIQQVSDTQKKLLANQNTIQIETSNKLALENQIKSHQDQLNQTKLYRQALVENLAKTILSDRDKLNENKHNKENLSALLYNLSQQSDQASHSAFDKMQKKLPRPIQSSSVYIQKLNQGLAFFTNEGTPVHSIFAGKVVFSDWLNGYGLLLIIDHGGGFMSLYAHNQSLYKQKGNFVFQGEQIASVGHSGGFQKNGLYFEIRRRGKAIPPLAWLS